MTSSAASLSPSTASILNCATRNLPLGSSCFQAFGTFSLMSLTGTSRVAFSSATAMIAVPHNRAAANDPVHQRELLINDVSFADDLSNRTFWNGARFSSRHGRIATTRRLAIGSSACRALSSRARDRGFIDTHEGQYGQT